MNTLADASNQEGIKSGLTRTKKKIGFGQGDGKKPFGKARQRKRTCFTRSAASVVSVETGYNKKRRSFLRKEGAKPGIIGGEALSAGVEYDAASKSGERRTKGGLEDWGNMMVRDAEEGIPTILGPQGRGQERKRGGKFRNSY